MGAQYDFVDHTNGSSEELDRRSGGDRFQIVNKRLWELRIENKKFPLDWVHDLSQTGMQVRQGFYNSFSSGQKIQVQIMFMGSPLLESSAEVKWVQEDRTRLNMNVLGLEFQNNGSQRKKEWINKKIERFLAKISKPILDDKAETSRQPFTLTTAHIVSWALFTFLAGFVFSVIH